MKNNKVYFIRSIPTLEPRLLRIINILKNQSFDITCLHLDRECILPKKEFTNGVQIDRFRFKWFKRSIGSLFVIPIWWSYIITKLLFSSFDILHVIDLENLPPAYLVAKLKNKKIIYEIFDYAADLYPSTYKMPFLRPHIKKIDDFFIKRVDGLILADDFRDEQIGLEISAQVDKILVIYNSPAEYNTINSIIEKNHIFTIFYGGILEKDRGLIELSNAVSELDDVQLIIAGFGNMKNEIDQISKKNPNVIFLGTLSHEEIMINTKKADLIPCLYSPDIINNVYASPNKFFESLYYSKPVIVYNESKLSKRVLDNNCGISIKYDSNLTLNLSNAILKLKNNKELYNTLSGNAESLYESKYSWTIMNNQLIKFYAQLFKK